MINCNWSTKLRTNKIFIKGPRKKIINQNNYDWNWNSKKKKKRLTCTF
jgi:hypothetical protein